MRSTWVFVLVLAAGAAVAQEDAVRTTKSERPTVAEATPDESSSMLTAADLRDKVQNMRRQVLGGGPAVEKSEKEALRFYRRKIEELARRADDLRTTRDLKLTEYELALDSTLDANASDDRGASARKAAKLRAEIEEVDEEIAGLEKQADALGRGVAAIQSRTEKRKRLLARLKGPEFYDELPYLSDELVDFEDEVESGKDPFLDDGFIEDLLRRDPERGRQVLFERDPAKYWARFPLTPPSGSLRRALRFPAPDLPAKR